VVTSPFLDTSILLAGLIELGQPAAAAQRVFHALAGRRLGRPKTAWHCCLEFYSVATRLPEEYRLRSEQAFQLLESEVFRRIEVLALNAPARLPFLERAARDGIVGGRLYDAHIAEVARRARVSVLITENVRHFASVSATIRVLTAREALREL
jgi:predicted nucleic acid-binding protein